MKYSLSIELDKNNALSRFKRLLELEVDIELKQIRKSRTVKQNAYMHVCIALFAIEFGNTLLEAKTDLKRECPFMRYEANEKQYLKQTSKMDSKELTNFIDWIRTYAGKQGLYIPTADEYHENQFSIDKENFDMSGLTVPKSEGTDIDAQLLERYLHISQIFKVVDDIFEKYLKLRYSDAWIQELSDMKDWIENL